MPWLCFEFCMAAAFCYHRNATVIGLKCECRSFTENQNRRYVSQFAYAPPFHSIHKKKANEQFAYMVEVGVTSMKREDGEDSF
jgi:hypothetical protein